MLQALREQTSSWVVKILLGLLILSFAVWGINDIFLGERDPTVAEVGDIKITRSQVNDEVRQEINRLQPLFGGRLDRGEADRIGITGQVVENMVSRALVVQGAGDLGIVISDEQVARRIMSDETFFSARGQFDRNVFVQVLARAGMSEGYYVASLKRDLAAAEIGGAIHAAARAPAAMLEPLVTYRAERRVARALRVPAPGAETVPDPSPAEIESYYQANLPRFMAPPNRDVSYVHLDPAVVAKEIQISEERIKRAYDELRDHFTVRDRRDLEQVVLKTREQAETVARAIAAGRSLEQAAEAAGDGARPVRLGWIERGDILPDLAEPVFALSKGGVTQPVRSPLGWHIVRVLDAEQGRVRPLAEVRDEIRDEIAQREAVDAIYGMINQLEDALAAGGSIEDAARQLNVRAVRVTGLDARGQLADSSRADGLAATPEFLRMAFETPVGQDSQLGETPDGGFFVVRVHSARPAEPRPLERVRAEAVAAWKADRRREASERRAAAILDRIRKGESLDAVARAEKLDAITSPAFTRLSHDAESGLPAALMDQLFTLRTGEAAMAETDDGHAVAVLTEVRAPTAQERTDTAASLQAELRDGIAGDLFEQFVSSLRGRYSVRINRNVLAADEGR